MATPHRLRHHAGDLWASRFRAHHSRLLRQDSSLHATRRLNELFPITRIDTARVSIAPVILGGGKRLFDYFDETVTLEHVGLLQSPFATHITYRIGPEDGRQPGCTLLDEAPPRWPRARATPFNLPVGTGAFDRTLKADALAQLGALLSAVDPYDDSLP